MRTSADRPLRFSATRANPCPRCGKLPDTSEGIFGRESWETRSKSQSGWATYCSGCKLGIRVYDYFPNGVDSEAKSIASWNAMCTRYGKPDTSKIDVNDLLEKAGFFKVRERTKK